MDNRRIALITETYQPEINGVANTLAYWVDGIKNHGIHIDIFRPKQGRNDANTQAKLENQYTVKGYPIPGYKELRFGLPQSKLFKRLWNEQRPDAIYIATEGPLGYSALKVAKKMGIRVISGFHTNFQSYSRFYHLGLVEPVILTYLRFFHNATAATLVPTLQQKQYLERMRVNNASVLRRGINCERFNPSKRSDELRLSWGAAKDEPVFIYVGRLAAEKNMELLSQTIASIQSRYPKAKFVLVGDGPMRKKLEAKHNTAHVIFTGVQSGEQLAQHYASGDIFLFPSTTDTFGNVVTEAMASGLCIVAYNDAAPRELLDNMRSGLLCDLGDEAAFIENAVLGYENPNLLKNISAASLNIAQTLTWDEITEQLIMSLYQKKQVDGGHHERKQDPEFISSANQT